MNVYDKIVNGDYRTKLERPDGIRRSFLARRASAERAAEYAKELAAYESGIEAFRVADAAYQEDQQRLNALFKAEAIAEILGEYAERFPATVEALWQKDIVNGDGDYNHSFVYGIIEEWYELFQAIKKDLDK